MTSLASAPGPTGDTSPAPRTLGGLKASGYRYRSVKRELRENAIRALASGENLFPGLVGYEDTVVPQLLQGVLSGHDVLLLGLRGQAKTRLLRAIVGLLDEWIPLIDHDGVDLPDDPLAPATNAGRRVTDELGDDTPVRWMHRSERYHEKLATPDVTIADLIGEIDLVKHAEGRYLSDESTIHFGLVPRSNRGLFVMNELPDLAPRIQVGLFNVLEERDVQVRGYPIRLNLDLCLMFSANPEDYTNRGRIVTPLKDRIGTVVRTHYPTDNREAMRITRENAFVDRRTASEHVDYAPVQTGEPRLGVTDEPGMPEIVVPEVMHEILEETVRQARTSAHINQASGVSVRASIALLETVVSAAEMRALRTGEAKTIARICDCAHLPSACRGKIELMLSEDSPDGSSTEDRLIEALFGEAVKQVVGRHLDIDDVEHIAEPFGTGMRLQLDNETSAAEARSSMEHVDGLIDAASALARELGMDPGDEQLLACCGELVLEFLYVNNRLSKLTGRGRAGYGR